MKLNLVGIDSKRSEGSKKSMVDVHYFFIKRIGCSTAELFVCTIFKYEIYCIVQYLGAAAKIQPLFIINDSTHRFSY